MTSVVPPPVRHPARHPALRPATMMASCRLGGVPRRTKVDISINLAVMPTRCVLTNSIIAKAESATSFSCASCGMHQQMPAISCVSTNQPGSPLARSPCLLHRDTRPTRHGDLHFFACGSTGGRGCRVHVVGCRPGVLPDLQWQQRRMLCL